MFDAVVNALSALAKWLDDVFVAIFVAVWSLFEDVFIDLLDLFLNGLTTVLAALPAPSFLPSGGLQSVFNQLSGDVLYFFGVFNIGYGITLLGSAFLFRMSRKVVTVFQW